MKAFFTFLFFGAMCVSSFAQLSESDFQDFTVYDLDGNSYNLYDQLDANKVVVIDVFATWCTNCIAAIPTVHTINADRGPDGDDSILMLYFERDLNTSNESAWVADYNIEIPVVTGAEQMIADLGITYQPVYIVICPDRSYQIHLGSIGNGSVLTDIIDQCNTATGVEEELRSSINFYAEKGAINARLTSPKNQKIELFNLVGSRIAQDQINAGEQNWSKSGLNTGIYILRFGDKSYKVIVP